MNTSRHALFSLSLVLCISGSQPLMAWNLPSKQLTFSLILPAALFWTVSIGSLISKDEPPKDRIDLDEAIRGLTSSKYRSDKSKTISQLLYMLWRDCLVGFAGKRRGIYPVGAKIFVEGKRRDFAHIVYPNDGESVHLIVRDNIPPYGFLGTLWAYLKTNSEGVKTVKDWLMLSKDICEFARWVSKSND